MKVKDKQWVRYKNNHIDKYDKDFGLAYNNPIKVADTPQELIQVGDMVFENDNEQPFVVTKTYYDEEGDLMYGNWFMEENYASDVTKILTPNSNGGYDLQWEVE